jgi:lysophospholipase L1-like esterase
LIWNEILCLGDSLTYGARDEYGRSYPAELGKILSQRTGEFYICHNYGVNGETSSDLLRRSWNIIRSNKASKIMLLMIGTNDTKKPTPLPIYRDNLRQIILSAKANGMNVVVATLPGLGFSPYYLNNKGFINRYNSVISALAHELRFHLCDMSDLEEHLIDGVHFTHEGYKEIATRWADKIQEIAGSG